MRFLSVAEREMRVASRRTWFYRARWLTALGFFGLLVWLAWGFDLGNNRRAAANLFEAYSVFIFFYCLLVGTATTADCLSRERREGTLGLLFLTNLSSLEIVTGKIASSSLTLLYSLLAIFPLLGLPLLFGGITALDFWCVVLALVNALWFAMAMGFVASALCVRQFPAVAIATCLALFFGAGWLGILELWDEFGWPREITDILKLGCPLKTLIAAGNNRSFFGRTAYWQSLTSVTALSTLCFLMVSWWIARAWRDRPKRARNKSSRAAVRLDLKPARLALRRRLLGINPFLWLASRQRVSAPVYMAISCGLILFTVWVMGPFFGKVLGAGTFTVLIGHVFAWMWTGLALHALTLYYAAAAASQRLAEDRQTGALELVLATSTNERTISRGLWLAYWRRMLFPILLATLVHLYFIWQGAYLFTIEQFERLPAGTTPWELLWAALTYGSIRGEPLFWAYGFMLRILLLAWVLFALAWITLGWLGRWLGLSLKRPGFAPLVALALVIIPPVLLFSFSCYLADELHFTRLPESFFLPVMLWIGFAIFGGHFLALAIWAGAQLRAHFRVMVLGRDLPESRRARWRTNGRVVLRVAGGLTVLVLLSAAFGYWHFASQNSRSQKRWVAFKKAHGDSLRLANVLPPAGPAAENFATSQVFQSLLQRQSTKTISSVSGVGNRFNSLNGFNLNDSTIPWIQQTRLNLAELMSLNSRRLNPSGTNSAATVLERLAGLRSELEAIAESARKRTTFAPGNARDRAAVLTPRQPELQLLETLNGIFELRACARIEAGDPAGAAQDIVTALRLTSLAAQSLDVNASTRAQVLAGRSIQPVWEGLGARVWDEAQLAAIQSELTRLDLLSTYITNVQRTVLAHIEIWDQFGQTPAHQRLSGATTYRYTDDWQPRGWWLDCAIELHRIGGEIVANVNPKTGWMRSPDNLGRIYELPLNSESQQLLQQHWWNAGFSSIPYAQTAVNQAVVACALERHRRNTGSFTDNLDELVPALLERLPGDVLRGRPLNYSRTNEIYSLRGTGFNLRDDLGQPGSDDWVWSFGTNSPAIK